MAYDIYMHNKPQEDTTPLTAESPTSQAAESPNLTVKGGVMLGYAAYAAKQVYQTAIEQTRMNGNESEANITSNMANIGTKAVMAYATGGLSLATEALSVGSQVYGDIQKRQRENVIRNIENSLRGQKIAPIGGGSFD
jgi:hypothetical protein